jgi:hypothetical protein
MRVSDPIGFGMRGGRQTAQARLWLASLVWFACLCACLSVCLSGVAGGEVGVWYYLIYLSFTFFLLFFGFPYVLSIVL